MNKRPDITENTKKALRDAFWKLYEEKAVEHISIKEITNLAGYNRGTFYLYYQDVYDILKQIEDSILEEADNYFASLLKNHPETNMEGIMKSIMNLYKSQSRHMNVMFSEHGSPQFKRNFKNKIKDLLRETMHREPDRDENPLRTEYLLEFYVSGLLDTLQSWHSNHEDLPVEELGEMLYEIYTHSTALS